MTVLLLATYELGRQPFGLASPAAWLREAGFRVTSRDLSRDRLEPCDVEEASLVAVHLPMHTATRLALPVLGRVREMNAAVHLCAYGLYAPPHDRLLRRHGVQTVLGPEFEADLLALAQRVRSPGGSTPLPQGHDVARLPRLAFRVPDRAGLPDVTRYAAVRLPSGERRVAGYTEASRGCKHTCRHCPVVPVYDGRFRVVPPDVVLADIGSQVRAGASHITFGDPDFFNGIAHARRVVEGLAATYPGVTYDVTIKIEHLLRHRDDLGRLRDTGCLFVTSAAESVDDRVLARLDKGHTRDDFLRVVELVRDARLAFSPTFVAFTPWTTIEGYTELLRTIASLDLIDSVAPIQLALRLLIPEGSLLMALGEVRDLVDGWSDADMVYRWRHPEADMDVLQRDVLRLVGRRLTASRRDVFETVCQRAAGAFGGPVLLDPPRPARATIPYLTEPWYC